MLTVYGIETSDIKELDEFHKQVATVLTVYGIETSISTLISDAVTSCNSAYRLRY